MFAGDVAGALTVVKTADGACRAVIKRRAIRHFFRQPLVDATPNHLGERQTTIASLRPQAARLLLGELNLGSNHGHSVSTSCFDVNPPPTGPTWEIAWRGRFHVQYVVHVSYVIRAQTMATSGNSGRQNVTISLSRQVLRKAKILAARRETSISGLLAQEIESLVGEDDAYERSERQARALLDRGFHLGGRILASRDELHER